jgi:hypothetical protein
MVGSGVRFVAAGIHVGPNHAGHSGIPARDRLDFASARLGASINRRSERAGGLHFEC